MLSAKMETTFSSVAIMYRNPLVNFESVELRHLEQHLGNQPPRGNAVSSQAPSYPQPARGDLLAHGKAT
jgi:hypothetical protein